MSLKSIHDKIQRGEFIGGFKSQEELVEYLTYQEELKVLKNKNKEFKKLEKLEKLKKVWSKISKFFKEIFEEL